MLFLSEERTNNTDCDCNQIQIIRVQFPTLRIAWLSDARSLAFLVRVLVRMRCSVLPTAVFLTRWPNVAELLV